MSRALRNNAFHVGALTRARKQDSQPTGGFQAGFPSTWGAEHHTITRLPQEAHRETYHIARNFTSRSNDRGQV